MSFLPDMVQKGWTQEEVLGICFESERERNRRRLQAIVCDHHLKQVKDFLLYNELAIWRRENGFDRVEAVEKNRLGDHRSLPPTPEQYYASLWAEVDALKEAISKPARTPWQKTAEFVDGLKGKLPDWELAEIKRYVEKRCRKEAQAQMTAVTRDDSVQHCSPISPNPDMPPNAFVKLENNEGTMSQELEELTSSASTGLNTPGQQESPPNEGVWETEPITADSILTAGVDSSKEGSSPMESVDTRASQESTTTTVAGTSSIAATPSKRRLKTSSEENKQFDPGGRGEQAPPGCTSTFLFRERCWEASCLPVWGGAARFLFFVSSMLCFFSCFPKLSIYETYQQAERRGSWTPIKSLMYATGGQALSRLLPYLKMAMTSNTRFDRSANGLR